MTATGRPRLVQKASTTALEPVPFDDRETTEDWLQALLDSNPGVLPIDEISSAWGPLISVGRELELTAGFVDNMFVSPAGELTVVEAKLWRNPESRRKVIGQILDYAAALARLTYEDLQDAVNEATGVAVPLWQRAKESPYGSMVVEESAFVDIVSRNLRAGRFLLLVVGDGIRSDLHGLAELLGSQPNLGFHLELVELRVYALPSSADLVVVPSLVGRTAEVARVIVDVRNSSEASVTVAVEIPEAASAVIRNKLGSVEDFVQLAAERIGLERAQSVADLAEWWRSTQNGLVKLNKQSINLSSPYRHTSGGSVSVMTIRVNGRAEGSVAPIAEWRGLIDADSALERYQAAGFAGDPLWPRLDIDLTQLDQAERIRSLLQWAADLVRKANDTDPPALGEGSL